MQGEIVVAFEGNNIQLQFLKVIHIFINKEICSHGKIIMDLNENILTFKVLVTTIDAQGHF